MTEVTSRPANLLLRALPENEYEKLAPHLTSVSFPVSTVIYQPLDPISTVYFPESTIFSLVSTLENGATTETAIVGCTGTVGLPVILGSGYANNLVVTQVEGSATAIPASILRSEFERGGELQRLLLLYAEARLSQVSQQVICNAQHTIQERLARWLLSVQELLTSDELPLTQEVIAQMLGVRRSSVTAAAGIFQQAGIIRYGRGRITILDQKALEKTSCECYHDLKAEFHRLLGFK
jgi:CRP-like cAMP-binding protein